LRLDLPVVVVYLLPTLLLSFKMAEPIVSLSGREIAYRSSQHTVILEHRKINFVMIVR
jgi:hypothetical protein